MAEFVQQSIEQMLPELEQMERVGLFSGKEIRAVLKKRKAFEYKLKRRTREKQDYLNYVQYEMNLLALVQKRRHRTGYNFKKFEIDVAILQRIHKLFKLVQFRFQDDVKLWLSHIEFSKKRQEKATVGRLYTRMLQIHNRKPELWISAAKWEMEMNASMDTARSLLQRGLRFNPQSKKLWIEYFRMELLNVDKLLRRKDVLGLADMEDTEENVSDLVVDGKVAEIVYRRAIEVFPDDVHFWLSFLPVCQLFSFAGKIEDDICKRLEEFHGANELTMQALACRYLASASAAKTEKMSKKDRKAAILSAEANCWNKFDEAVISIPTEKMWSLYLETCLSRLELKGSRKVTEKRLLHTESVFNRAAAAGKISEVMTLNWCTLLKKTGQVERLLDALSQATTLYPGSVFVWLERIKTSINLGLHNQLVLSLAVQCFNSIPQEESLCVWQLVIQWCVINEPDHVETLLEKGLKSCPNVASVIKEMYLEWTALSKSMADARSLYTKLSSSKPLSVEFFRKFIDLEKAQLKPKIQKLRNIYEDALREYGSSNTELWLEFMQLEMHHPNGKPETAGQLHWRAIKTLDGHLVEKFTTHYTLIQTGHL